MLALLRCKGCLGDLVAEQGDGFKVSYNYYWEHLIDGRTIRRMGPARAAVVAGVTYKVLLAIYWQRGDYVDI
jgi:hypothetical protein